MCIPFRWFKKRRQNFERLHECSCNVCGTVCETMEQLIIHIGGHSTDEINNLLRRNYGTVRCNKCYLEFRTVSDMEKHSCATIIPRLSPIPSADSLESVLIREE